MHGRDPETVPGHADCASQPLVDGSEQSGHGTVRGEGGLPLVRFDEVVELDEVDSVDTQTLKTLFQLSPCCVAGSLPGLGSEKELVAVVLEKIEKSPLTFAVRRRRINVVDAGVADGLERGIGPALAHRGKRRGSEDQAAALVAGGSERETADRGHEVPRRWRTVARSSGMPVPLSALTQVTSLRATPSFSVNSVRRFFDFDGLTLSALVAT